MLFYKQKTAYGMRISDWSSDVCSSDLLFVIDPRPFNIALASAKAELARATARLELAKVQLARAEKLRANDFVAASTYDERSQERQASSDECSVGQERVSTC